MKRLHYSLIIFLMCNIFTAIAQTSEDRNGVSFKGLAFDHVRKNSIADWTYGAEIAYSRYMNPSFDLIFPFRAASVDLPERKVTRMLSLDGRVAYKLSNGYILKENSCISPYIFVGFGLAGYNTTSKKVDPQIPLGIGLDIRLMPAVYVQLQSEYKKSLSENRDHLVHGLGLKFLLNCGDKEEVMPIEPVTVVNVIEDKDGDSVPDAEDSCPYTPGLPELKGCPEIKEEIKAILARAMYIQFETNSDKIKGESFSVLDEVVQVLRDNPTYHVELHGHTDSQGKEDYNMDLSQRRAMSAMNYLVSKGIDATRLSTVGYGESSPVDDNGTEAGRAKNRRVEFIVK